MTIAAKTSFRDRYVDSHSEKTCDRYIAMREVIQSLHPHAIVTCTEDLPLMKYVKENSDIKAVQDKSYGQFKSIGYKERSRRLGEDSTVVDNMEYAVYDVETEKGKLLAYMLEIYTERWFFVGDEDVATALIKKVHDWQVSFKSQLMVYNREWQPDEELWKGVQNASWDDVVLDQVIKKRLIHEYTSFFKSRDLYKALGVPWKRGLILLGPPGNGKTTSLKALMKDVGVPLLFVREMSSYDIHEVFERARDSAPCVLIFEDLDSMIDECSRTAFLNEVDGIEDNDGLLLIGTTNHFERLDPAISSRPSRFDRKYIFPNPEPSERLAYALYWQAKVAGMPRVSFPETLAQEVAKLTDGFSFAYLKEMFIAGLISLANQEEEGGDEAFGVILKEQIGLLHEELERMRKQAKKEKKQWEMMNPQSDSDSDSDSDSESSDSDASST